MVTDAGYRRPSTRPNESPRVADVFSRYVALGDSQTEGLNDGDDATGYRGWADRLAEQLAVLEPDLLYANLAVRGKTVGQIRSEQLDAALALQPDLATVMGGLNDILRPHCDMAAVVADLDDIFAALTATGARVATSTFPDVSKIVRIARRLVPRVLELNAGIREAAGRHGVAVLDSFGVPVVTDPRIWSADRIHATPLGHQRIADAMAHALGLPGASDDWQRPLEPAPLPSGRQILFDEARWIAVAGGPWVVRRMRGRSSGDGRTPKRPSLLPVEPATSTG